MSKLFHVIIHATEAADSKFAYSFEQVSDAFEQLPRMFLEPDGSFVWVINDGTNRYQLDGLLVDDGSHLLTCELKGTCDNRILDQFLIALGWPDQNVVFQRVHHGVFLSESKFREESVD